MGVDLMIECRVTGEIVQLWPESKEHAHTVGNRARIELKKKTLNYERIFINFK